MTTPYMPMKCAPPAATISKRVSTALSTRGQAVSAKSATVKAATIPQNAMMKAVPLAPENSGNARTTRHNGQLATDASQPATTTSANKGLRNTADHTLGVLLSLKKSVEA